VPATALVRIPEGYPAVHAAPMGCAGVTAFNSLRRSAARPGDLVAVLGVGGLGHLGIQFASAMGFEVAAIARGMDKADLATQLGAHHYIDSAEGEVAARLQALGGSKRSTRPISGCCLATQGFASSSPPAGKTPGPGGQGPCACRIACHPMQSGYEVLRRGGTGRGGRADLHGPVDLAHLQPRERG